MISRSVVAIRVQIPSPSFFFAGSLLVPSPSFFFRDRQTLFPRLQLAEAAYPPRPHRRHGCRLVRDVLRHSNLTWVIPAQGGLPFLPQLPPPPQAFQIKIRKSEDHI